MTLQAFEYVLKHITQAITSGELQNGSVLPSERDMAVRLSVGRQTVREAYRMLQAQGVATVRRGKEGGTVIQSDHGAALAKFFEIQLALEGSGREEVTEIRIAFERALVEIAARKHSADGDFVADLETLLETMDATPNIEVFNEADTEFHLRIARQSDNPLLTDMFAAIRCSMAQPIAIASHNIPDYEHFRGELQQQHHHIFDAIRSGEATLAAQLVEDHIRFAYSILPLRDVIRGEK